MKRLSLRSCLVATLTIGGLLTPLQVGFAQHHHGGVATHRSGFQLFNPHGVRVVDHHDDYRYVIPPSGHHGAFYTYHDVHYYTPPVTRVVVQQPQFVPQQPQQFVQNVVPATPPQPVQLKFGGFQLHQQLAERLESMANQFCLDLHYNYQHNPRYAEAYREAYKLLQAAKYIHGREHQGDHAMIQRSGNSIDELFHHVQGEVRGWRSGNQRQVGQLSFVAKTEELEALIHHLMFDIGVKPAHDDDEAAPPPREEAPPPAGEPRSVRIPIPPQPE